MHLRRAEALVLLPLLVIMLLGLSLLVIAQEGTTNIQRNHSKDVKSRGPSQTSKSEALTQDKSKPLIEFSSLGGQPSPIGHEFPLADDSVLGMLAKLIGLTTPEVVAILNVVKLGIGVVRIVDKIISKVLNGSDSSFNFHDSPGTDRQILAMFQILTSRLDQIQRGLENTEASLKDLARGLPHMVRWEIALDTMEEYVRPINNLYHKFDYYQTHRDDIESLTLLDFSESVVSHDTHSIQSLMANIHSMVSPSKPPGAQKSKGRTLHGNEYEVYVEVSAKMSQKLRQRMLEEKDPSRVREGRAMMESLSIRNGAFKMMMEALQEYEQCNMQQTQQQLVFGLYTLLAITLAKGYAMVNFAYLFLKFDNQGNFVKERQLARELYLHYSESLQEEAEQALEIASDSYWRCDPRVHKENVTYIRFTELLQGYIENEVDLNYHSTCGHNCGYYEHAQVAGCYLPDNQYCGKHRRCKGKVHNCRFFDADAWVCISNDRHKRYDWIKYENNRVLGQKRTCDNVMKVDSWWRWFYHCSYCMCLCDDPKSYTSDRYVSLMPSVSDVVKNKVVTGLRFAKRNRILHLQVQQGQALPQGMVDPKTLQWAEVEEMSIGGSKYLEGEHYQTLQYEIRNFDLDKLMAPKDHVITGVKFRMHGPHVNLEVWVTPIEFTNGTLDPSLSYWISNDNTPVMTKNPRREVLLYDPDVPNRSPQYSRKDSSPDTYIRMQPTSIHSDVSQQTVPYFDAQEVVPHPSSWLAGVELYHKGQKGYGGFIAPMVYNYNMTRQLLIQKHFDL